MHMKFRSDINGLRAIAVIAVVLFHFNSSLIPGGFAGVDVFFVISGYLMTSIIFRGIENNSFSLFGFYVSRVNRILPALLALSFVLLVFGWFALEPDNYKTLGKHIVSSLGFFSNITYWLEAGSYFDALSYEKWLLHTWSLSVEWQFYIFYPLILLFLKKLVSAKKIKHFVLIGFILSFAVSVYATNKWPSASYYLLPTRAWEMLLGGVAYLYPFYLNEKNKKIIEWLGLFLILYSYIFISKNDLWPGYLAFVPVFGTYLIIVANQQKSIVTNNIIFQKLGKWSYSIYLWHWPIYVYGCYFAIENWAIIGIPLSVLLGWLSFKYIESYKFPKLNSWKLFFKVKPFLFTLLLGGMAFSIYSSGGAYQRFLEKDRILVEKLSKKIIMPDRSNKYCFYQFGGGDKKLKIDLFTGVNCFKGENIDNKVDTLLFGDSFAGHMDPFWNSVFINLGKSYQSVSTNWCFPSFTKNFVGPKNYPSYRQCLLNRDFLKDAIYHNKYKNIIFASSWNGIINKGYLDDFLNVVSEANKHNIKIFVVATPSSYKRNPIPLFLRSIYFHETFNLKKYESEYQNNNYVNDILKKKLKKYPNVYFLDRKTIFGEANTFKYRGQNSELDVPYTLDGHHISLLGSISAAKKFLNSPAYVEFLEELNK